MEGRRRKNVYKGQETGKETRTLKMNEKEDDEDTQDHR
jgi:hypothetical protein